MAVGGVMSRSSTIFLSASSLPAFLFLSLLLLSFRSVLHVSTLAFTSFLDSDPTVRSLLSRIDSSSDHHHHHHSPSSPFPPPSPPPPHHRPPFFPSSHHSLHLHHDHDDSHYYYHHDPASDRSRNSTFLLVADNLSLRVRSFAPWKPSRALLLSVSDDGSGGEDDHRSAGKLRFLGLSARDFRRRDAAVLLYLAAVFSALHVYAILGFLLFYSCAFGVVFYAVTCALLGKDATFFQTLTSGFRLGIRRLPPFLFLYWAIRDALAQLLCVILFSARTHRGTGVTSFLKLFVKVKLMPFFVMTAPPPSMRIAADDDPSHGDFLFVWTLLDTVISIVFMVICWAAIMHRSGRRRGPSAVKEACCLLSRMTSQAILINCFEMMLCKDLGRKILTMVGGPLLATVVQSVGEMYFMVAWLLFYFVAKSRTGGSDGRRLRWRDIEDGINIWR